MNLNCKITKKEAELILPAIKEYISKYGNYVNEEYKQLTNKLIAKLKNLPDVDEYYVKITERGMLHNQLNTLKQQGVQNLEYSDIYKRSLEVSQWIFNYENQ